MNPDVDPTVLAYLIGALVAGALGLLLIPLPCSCKHCAYHTHQRKVEAEKARVRRHRMLHHTYNIPWGDAGCAQCQLGHRDDELRRHE